MTKKKPSEWINERAMFLMPRLPVGQGALALSQAIIDYLDRLHEEGKI